MAIVLTFDGAVGSVSEVVDGQYTGRPGGPFTYREGKAQAIRELAEREGIDLAASWAYSDSESDLPMLRAVGHPVAVNPDAELARVAREEGWEVLRFERLGRRLRVAGRAGGRRGARRRGRAGRAPAGERMSLHELTPEQQEIRALARRFADEQVAPHAAAWDREHAFPREIFAQLGELGLMGVCVPAEHGGAGADFLAYVLVLEELSRADAGLGVSVAVHTSAGTLPILAHGTPEQAAALRSAAGRRRGDRRVRADRAGLGLGRRRDAHARRATARITGAKQWITNGSFASSFIVFARDAETGIGAHLVRAGRRRLRGHARGGEARAELVLDRRPHVRGHARRAPGRPGPGHADRARHARRRPHRDRRAGRRDRAGRARPGHRLREGAPRLRRPDRPPAGDPAQARRHADRDRGGARAGLARGAPEGGRAPAQRRGRAGQAVRQPGRAHARPARRSRSSAATATRRSSRPSATTATPRSPRSTRGPRRSRSW